MDSKKKITLVVDTFSNCFSISIFCSEVSYIRSLKFFPFCVERLVKIFSTLQKNQNEENV